jgi:hypothetical protein
VGESEPFKPLPPPAKGGVSLKSRLARLGPHAAAPVALVLTAIGLVVAAWFRFNSVSLSTCPSSFHPDIWPTGGFSAVLGAFLLGGLLGNVPHKRGTHGYGLLTQFGLVAAIAVITFAWWYETHALASESPTTEPITFYIMCIRLGENDWTLFVFVLAALLAGRWLWHRPGAYLQ